MPSKSMNFGMRFFAVSAMMMAFAGCTDVAPDTELTAQETTRIYGRVDGYVASGDTVPLPGVRIAVRSLGFGSDYQSIETISHADGRYELDVPRGWASVTFEQEGYASASRTEDFRGSSIVDVQLPTAASGSAFVVPEAGDAPVILTYESTAGREYTHIRIEPGDLVDARGRPASGDAMAFIAAPHPRDTHKDAFPHSLYAADEVGVSTLQPFAFTRFEFYQGNERLDLAEGQSLDWEIELASEQLAQAQAGAESGTIQDYQFDPDSGLWQALSSTVTYDNGRLKVQRSALGDGSVGMLSALPLDEGGDFSFRSSSNGAKCVEPGRSVMLLLTMSNPLTPTDVAASVIRSAVAYLANGKSARVLVVLDDNHNGEFSGDAEFIGKRIKDAGYTVTVMNEPSAGLRAQDVSGYDVVWFTNPGHPVDDRLTMETLKAFRLAGGGYVLSGDDMTMSSGGFDMSPYTFTKHVDNGVTTCGKTTNNNLGASWRVTFEESDHPMSAGLDGLSFLYGDDLDHSTALADGEDVLAWAILDGYPSCNKKIPVVIAIDIEKSSQYTPCACDRDNDCAGSRHCDEGACVSCSITGYTCATDDDCCGDLACNDGVCGDACQGDGDSCSGSTDCCGTMSCVEGSCASCSISGADCTMDDDCCGGLLCVEGSCQSCRGAGEACGDDGDCCGMGTMGCELSTKVQAVTDTTVCAGDQVLDVTIRDFSKSHADFEYRSGSETGIVASTLGSDGKPVYAGNPNTYTTNGKLLFDQWFRDVAGVNKTIASTIELSEVSPGIYQYKSDAFFPIDGRGYGNEGNNHNFHFTLEMHTEFIYRGGEVFTFTGDDDLFAFINGQLVIDLGGVHGKLSRTVDLDTEASRLGLRVGRGYPLDVFFAERHTTQSNFRIDTTIGCLGEVVEETVTELRCEPTSTTEKDCGGGEGLIGLDSVTISGGAAVRSSGAPADVASNGEIKISGGGRVDGNATTGGSTITVNGGGSIGGVRTTGSTPFTSESMAEQFARVKANNNNSAIPSVIRNGKAASVYVKGELRMQDNDAVTLPPGDYAFSSARITASAVLRCTGTVRMFISGDVTMAGNARINADKGCNLIILSDNDGDVSFTASTITHGYVYAPEATVKVAGSAAVHGGILGRETDLSGSGTVYVTGNPIEQADACKVIENEPSLPELPELPDHPS